MRGDIAQLQGDPGRQIVQSRTRRLEKPIGFLTCRYSPQQVRAKYRLTTLPGVYLSAGTVKPLNVPEQRPCVAFGELSSPANVASATIVATMIASTIVWHHYGTLFAYLLGLPDYLRLASYAAFLLLTPYALYRRSTFDAYDMLVISLTALVWLRSSFLIADNEIYETAVLYLAGFCIPSLVIVRLWPAAKQNVGVYILFVGLTVGEILAAFFRVSTETGRAVFEFDITSNPVGLSVSTISAVTVATACALHLWHSVDRGVLWRRALSLAVFGIIIYLLVKAVDLGTRSLLIALGLASCVMIAHRARRIVGVLIVVFVGAVALFVTMPPLLEGWQPPARVVEFVRLISDAKSDVTAVLRWGDQALIERFYWWQAYLDCFIERTVFGCGLRVGSAESGVPYAHNIFIGIAGELGIVGLTLLTGLCVVIVNDIRGIWSRKDAVASAGLGLVIAGLVQLQFSLDLPIAKHFIVGAALLRSAALNTKDKKAR